MFRIFGPGLVGFLALALWIYCIFDVIATEESLVRNLRKPVWLLIVILLSTVGSLAWLLLGRPQYAGWRPGETSIRPPRPRAIGPEDDPHFPQSLPGSSTTDDADRLRRWEEDLRRREDDLRRGDEDGGDSPPPPSPGQ
ncbi:MAG: PLD nuclease N-terminal domain-containing protein [Acidimicrobiales bacterium]